MVSIPWANSLVTAHRGTFLHKASCACTMVEWKSIQWTLGCLLRSIKESTLTLEQNASCYRSVCHNDSYFPRFDHTQILRCLYATFAARGILSIPIRTGLAPTRTNRMVNVGIIMGRSQCGIPTFSLMMRGTMPCSRYRKIVSGPSSVVEWFPCTTPTMCEFLLQNAICPIRPCGECSGDHARLHCQWSHIALRATRS